MNTQLTAIETRLDEIEERLPALPAAVFKLQRAMATQTMTAANGAWKTWRRATESMCAATSTAAKTVTGTARWVGERTATVAGDGARTVAGQARAQARIAKDAVTDEVEDLVESTRGAVEDARDTAVDAIEAVESVVDESATPTGETYQDLTKAELYRRAKLLDIEGRSTMSKTELIAALEAA